MSHDPHNNGYQENKPVSFTTPLILGVITVFIILCFVSLGNPCHGHGNECCDEQKCSKECMEACEKDDHSKHPAAMGHEEGHSGAMHEEHATETTTDADSTHTEPAKEEAHH